MKRYALIGAPSSAGANTAGLEGGPAHFRKCGILAEFALRDIQLSDHGDCPEAVFTTDPMDRTARNLAAVAAAARNVRAHCEMALSRGEVVILIGGDCTVSVGLVTAAGRKVKRLGLIYMDSQTDLNTPATTDTGILDSMGLAHMLGFVTNPLSALGGGCSFARRRPCMRVWFSSATDYGCRT
jgi:arginase